MHEQHVDVLIFGGGIAGLWTLARLRKAGYSCLLLEANSLGGGQTIASQGIIHGGVKYALGGGATSASKAIAEMPGIWRACLQGQGEIDLRSVTILSDHQYLWTTPGIGSRIAGLAASKVIRTSVESVPCDRRPGALREAPRAVDVYAVDEPVLNPRSIVQAVTAEYTSSIARLIRGERGSPELLRENGELIGAIAASARRPYDGLILRSRATVLSAGEGNALLLALGDEAQIASQRGSTQLRPLHMLMARAQHDRQPLPALFGHCIGFSDKPRLTITTNADTSGRPVWYIGGGIAERGVAMSGPELIGAAHRELAACLPWIDLTGIQWATLRINRAEGAAQGERPDEPVVRRSGRTIAVWPTKLAFAPLAAARVVDELRAIGLTPSGSDPSFDSACADLVRPNIAPLPWDKEGVLWT